MRIRGIYVPRKKCGLRLIPATSENSFSRYKQSSNPLQVQTDSQVLRLRNSGSLGHSKPRSFSQKVESKILGKYCPSNLFNIHQLGSIRSSSCLSVAVDLITRCAMTITDASVCYSFSVSEAADACVDSEARLCAGILLSTLKA